MIDFLVTETWEWIAAAQQHDVVGPIAGLLEKFPLSSGNRVFAFLQTPSWAAEKDFSCRMAVFAVEDPSAFFILREDRCRIGADESVHRLNESAFALQEIFAQRNIPVVHDPR